MKRTLNLCFAQTIGLSVLTFLLGTIAMGKGKPPKPPDPDPRRAVEVTFTSGLDIESDGGSYIDGDAGVSAAFTDFNHMHLGFAESSRTLNISFDDVVTSTEASPDWIGSIPFSGSLSFRIKEVANVPDTSEGLTDPDFASFCVDLESETGESQCFPLVCEADSDDPACSADEDGGSMDGVWYVRRTGLALNLKPEGEKLSYSFWHQNPNSDYDFPDESAYVRVFHVTDNGEDVWILSPERVDHGTGPDAGSGPLGTLIRLSRKSVQAGQYLVDFRASVRELPVP